MIHEHHINTLVDPTSLTVFRQTHYKVTGASAVSRHAQWPILDEEAEHRGGTWAAINPEHERCVLAGELGFEKPVEEVMVGARLGIGREGA